MCLVSFSLSPDGESYPALEIVETCFEFLLTRKTTTPTIRTTTTTDPQTIPIKLSTGMCTTDCAISFWLG